MPDYIMTRTGRRFSHGKPDPAAIHIEDIATSISNQCRFLGHTNVFFSIAQHSWEVGTLCYDLTYDETLPFSNAAHAARIAREAGLAGLLHDAHEAYVGDFPTPFKDHLGDIFRVAERGTIEAVETALGIAALMKKHHDVVKEADRAMLYSDAIRWGMDEKRVWVPKAAEAHFQHSEAWAPKKARKVFMKRFKEWGGPAYVSASELLRAA